MRLTILLGIFAGMCFVHVHCISDSENKENLNEAISKAIVKSTCEKNKLQVDCPKGQVLSIVQAIYGRVNNLDKCNPNKNKNFNTKCRSSKSLTIMRQRCHLKRSCSVDATNSVFGDPCPKTIKYLEIQYRCVAERVTTKITNVRRTTPKATTPKKRATTKIPNVKRTTPRATTPKKRVTTKITNIKKTTPRATTPIKRVTTKITNIKKTTPRATTPISLPTTNIPPKKVTPQPITTSKRVNFICPNLDGTFVHPTDCTKYYSCSFFVPSLMICPDNELFDGVKQQCRPAKEVHCGTRIRPTEPTIPDTTLEITTLETTTEEAEPPTTTTTTESTTTTPSPTTTEKPRVTAPDTTCTEDDLDCIIDDLGENPVWFVCDEDMGSYPHPTSSKLFIFCLNWKPSVKKCGQDLIFSKDLMTCVSP